MSIGPVYSPINWSIIKIEGGVQIVIGPFVLPPTPGFAYKVSKSAGTSKNRSTFSLLCIVVQIKGEGYKWS